MPESMIEKFKLKILMVEDKMLSADVVEVMVDTNLFLPAMFTIVIEDDGDPLLGVLKYSDLDPRFKIGMPISIGFEIPDRITGMVPISNTLIKGEITSIEPLFVDGHAQLCIRGYDRSHRLMRGKNTRAFLKVNEMMIISKLAGEAGLSPSVGGTTTTFYDYVLQYNQSNWDFLMERAQLYGYQFYADDKVLKVIKGGSPRTLLPVTLSWKNNLRRFEPRLVSMGQVTKSTVLGWDPDLKKSVKAFSATSVPKTKTGELLTGSTTAMSAFGMAEDVFIPDRAIRTQGDAQTIATARFDDNQSQFIKASGEVDPGDPNLVAGTMAVVTGVGTRFSGTYYVTEARHTWRAGSYTTQFQVSGANPHTVQHLLTGEAARTDKISGVVVAKVTNVTDIENLGRVKVTYPWMPSSLSEVESFWARVAVPSAGKERGIYFSPEVDDEVLVAFENGDMNYPYIIGSLWNNTDKPPKGTEQIVVGGKVNQRIVRSRSGHVIVLDDTQGKEQIIIQDKTNKNSIVIDSKTNAMTIKAQGDLTIEAGGKLIIKSKGDFSIASDTKGAIEAKQSTNVKAGTSQLDLQASGAALKGTKVDVQANAQVSVQGNAMVQIQGGIVKIN
jgi:uncharacterized protein involved in type VI secretion and phage assembly